MNDKGKIDFRSDKPELQRPPRTVPLFLALRVLFGGFLSQFGWVFFGFGMIFFWAFGVPDTLANLFKGVSDIKQAEGVVTSWSETNASENDRDVYQINFRFVGEDSLQYSGTSYATGRYHKPGATVIVEYDPAAPENCRIQGMRKSVFGEVILFVMIFPLIGFVFIVFGVRQSLRGIRLLKFGESTRGTFVRKEATNTTVNDQTVYKLFFEFKDDAGRSHEAIAKTHVLEPLLDEAQELLLYDPYYPDKAILFDNLPGGAEFDEWGNLSAGGGRGFLRLLLLLIIPGLSIAGHGYYMLTYL